jgi:reverse gyrase
VYVRSNGEVSRIAAGGIAAGTATSFVDMQLRTAKLCERLSARSARLEITS